MIIMIVLAIGTIMIWIMVTRLINIMITTVIIVTMIRIITRPMVVNNGNISIEKSRISRNISNCNTIGLTVKSNCSSNSSRNRSIDDDDNNIITATPRVCIPNADKNEI